MIAGSGHQRYTWRMPFAAIPMPPTLRIAPLLILLALPAPARSADHDSRILAIERSLRPAQALAGRPVPLTTVEDEMRRRHVPGLSVAVIDGGRLAWAKGYGAVTPGGAPVTPATLFQAASISKPVTAFGAMTMVQAGSLQLQADVNGSLRGWTLGAARVNALQLLSHTAGLNVSGFPGYAPGMPVPTLEQVLDGAAPASTAPIRVTGSPGAAWRYSGGGYTVLQQLMTDLAGQPFEHFMHRQVLAPLGMSASSFAQPPSSAMLAQAALPHDSAGKPYPGGPATYPELAAAGMWSTPSDLARFAMGVQAAAGGDSAVLSRAHAHTMLTPVRNGYALGFEMTGSGAAAAFAHGGSNRGYQNYLYGFVHQGSGAVVMSNGDAGDEVARAMMRAIAAEYNWPGYQTVMRKALATTPRMARQMRGTYAIKGLGTFDITVENGQPIFWLKAGQGEALYRHCGTRFFVLSQALEVRFDALPGRTGRVMAGPFDVRFQRQGR